jgi:hypothetical protein
MSDEESSLDGKTQSTQEFVAKSILRRFPLATLNAVENRSGTIYELYFQDKLVLRLDAKGARYFFPSRRKRMVKWEKVSTFGLPRVIEYILRDLAEVDFQVLSTTNKEMLKRPIHISSFMRCPDCKTGGGMKLILRAESLTQENSEIYTPISRSVEINGAEVKCTLCGWIGVRQQLLRKIRKPRKA